MVGCLIAGSKCTKKNGATAVIPGSHLWGPDRAPKVEECTHAEMEAGDALFTLGSCYHGAGENQCEKTDPDALRTLFAVFGQRDYFRQDQEEVLSTPLELARTFPEDILRIAGYCKYFLSLMKENEAELAQIRPSEVLVTSKTIRILSNSSRLAQTSADSLPWSARAMFENDWIFSSIRYRSSLFYFHAIMCIYAYYYDARRHEVNALI